MTKNKGFRNLKNWFQDWTGCSIVHRAISCTQIVTTIYHDRSPLKNPRVAYGILQVILNFKKKLMYFDVQSKWSMCMCTICTFMEYHNNLYKTYGNHHGCNCHGHLCNYVYQKQKKVRTKTTCSFWIQRIKQYWFGPMLNLVLWLWPCQFSNLLYR